MYRKIFILLTLLCLQACAVVNPPMQKLNLASEASLRGKTFQRIYYETPPVGGDYGYAAEANAQAAVDFAERLKEKLPEQRHLINAPTVSSTPKRRLSEVGAPDPSHAIHDKIAQLLKTKYKMKELKKQRTVSNIGGAYSGYQDRKAALTLSSPDTDFIVFIATERLFFLLKPSSVFLIPKYQYQLLANIRMSLVDRHHKTLLLESNCVYKTQDATSTKERLLRLKGDLEKMTDECMETVFAPEFENITAAVAQGRN